MSKFLGIDLGSSTIKGAVIDPLQGTIDGFRQRPFPQPTPGLPPSCFEIDLDEIIRATRELLAELASAVSDCDGIFFSSQMGGVVVARTTGEALTRYISWRDLRSMDPHPSREGPILDQLKRCTSAHDLSRIGNELQAGSASSILYALSQTNQMPSGELIAMGLGDFVVWQLGGAQPRTELTMSVGSVDLDTGDIYHDWFDRVGLGGVAWPELVQIDKPIGTIDSSGQSLPVYPAVGDHQAALLGAGVRPGELSINISTGSQVGLITTELASSRSYQTRPFFDGQYVNTVTHLPAGRALNALVDLLTELPRKEGYTADDPWAHILRAVDSPPSDAPGPDVNLAFFDCHIGDRGHISGMRLDNMTVGQLFRGAFDHMIDNYSAAASRLAPESDWSCVVMSGGLSQKISYVRRRIEDRLGPTRISNCQEETLTGLLRLAQRAACM